MSGRGRGRGRGGGHSSIPAGTQGITRNNQLPALITQPETYPPIFFRPHALCKSTRDRILSSSKESLFKYFNASNSYIRPKQIMRKLERYSDKYEQLNRAKETQKQQQHCWDYDLYPEELRPTLRAKRAKLCNSLKSASGLKNDVGEVANTELAEILDDLEKKERANGEATNEQHSNGDGDEEDVEADAGIAEEDFEEENDYADTYFDNGEAYGNESDDNLDGEATF